MDQPSPAEAPPLAYRPVPAAVRWAVRVMYAGAAASVAGTATYILTWYFEDYLVASRALVHGDSGVFITGSPVVAWLIGLGGLVVLCLWLWTAWMCAQGRGWARIVATVLLALQTYTLYRDPFIRLGVSWTDVVPRVSFLIGLTAVILLWQRSAGPYFKARAAISRTDERRGLRPPGRLR